VSTWSNPSRAATSRLVLDLPEAAPPSTATRTKPARSASRASKKSGKVLPVQPGSRMAIQGRPSPKRSNEPSTPKLIAMR
jgi:hypothetical protein